MTTETKTIDGNEAAASMAYKTNEIISIYPITPASPMGEMADMWASKGNPNIYGTIPHVIEMQSEAGAIGSVHGSLQRGSLTTTFTASQGLLLMIPDMFKIAGELNPMVIHVAARTIATHALSIFCDHSDVMAVRGTGFAILCSSSVQEAQDMALISQAATLKSRIPFVHFFDGFRTSHEISKIAVINDTQIADLIDEELIRQHRSRALSPENPFIRGTSQNPDIFFQAREASNQYYNACVLHVLETMDSFNRICGRSYKPFEYYGSPDAERVIVIMGSASQTVMETIDCLNKRHENTGMVQVRLYRPFSSEQLLKALPHSIKSIAVLDRTKEPGSMGEPLYTDIVTSVTQAYTNGETGFRQMPRIISGRYGLSSKEFTPPMVETIYAELNKTAPRRFFTIGINDDVSGLSLTVDYQDEPEPTERIRAIFFGYGSDGTVSANKNTLKIIGENTDFFVQGYFIYDSMKSGSLTVSHLRFDSSPIRSEYHIHYANFIACHQFDFLNRILVLNAAQEGATFLLNSPYPVDTVWDKMPAPVQEMIIKKKITVYVIDAYKIAAQIGLGRRINTIMQTCFFHLCNLVPVETATTKIKEYLKKSYGSRGDIIVEMNYKAVDMAIPNLHLLKISDTVTSSINIRQPVPSDAPDYVKNNTARILTGAGDLLPVSAFEADGTFASGTTQYLKRTIASEVPQWDPSVCIQCGRCSVLCPHAVVRAKVYEKADLSGAPASFQSMMAKHPSLKDHLYTVAISPEDCTGCKVCVEVCPAKNKAEPKYKALNMVPIETVIEDEKRNWEFFKDLPDYDKPAATVRELQFVTPLFEFSGACAGCGETPYLTLLSRLYGDQAVIANATGCSSIYGGNEPSTPWTKNKEGKGPAWSNSLFEDNAEFGLGFRLSIDKQYEQCIELMKRLEPQLGTGLIDALIHAEQKSPQDRFEQRSRVKALRDRLTHINSSDSKNLLALSDALIKKSVWLVGGDGWGYDIGYGGLDHVLSLGKKVTILVMDTEMYSNTGGQMSKATPMGSVAKFASSGKKTAKKDLVMMAMSYGSVYVARVAMGADQVQTIKAFMEADEFEGTSLIVAYAHCIGQGYDLIHGNEQQKLAVQSGYWPLLRYDPRLSASGKNPLQLDSGEPSLPLDKYIYNETRYRVLLYSNPEAAAELLENAGKEVKKRWNWYKHWSEM